MVETKFTPGPWSVNKKAKMNVRSSDDTGIASCGGEVTYEQACNNANLVAAAPDMYEALSNLLEEFRIINDCEVEWRRCE